MRYQTGLAGWITLALLLGAHGVAAQVRADSTTSAVPRDPVATRSPDTTTAAPDSAAPRAAAASPAPAPIDVAPPVETVLARACSSAPAGASAPGLLAVVFQAHATESDRVAAAGEVGGRLAGVADGGEDYIQLPENGGPIRTAAARLIRLSSVSSVAEMSCPR